MSILRRSMTLDASHDKRGSRQRLAVAALVAVSALLISVLATMSERGAYAAPPDYVPHSALINGDSISGGSVDDSNGNPISLEQYAAERAGFTVTVVSGATWSAMSAADFAKYQLLIIGDATCSTVPASVTTTASTWAPVVMGTAGGATDVGNRVLIGTDPVFHYFAAPPSGPTDPNDPSTAGAEQLIEGGIIYAGGVDGATGVYFDTTCGQTAGNAVLPVLDMLTSEGTGWTRMPRPRAAATLRSSPMSTSSPR